MKKLCSLALALTLLLTGCHAPEQQPQSPEIIPDEQIEAIPEDIPFQLAVYDRYSLHPILAGNRANLALTPLLYEPLFALNASFEAEPVLCERTAISEDGLVWTLELRQNVTFSDGTPLTGEIVASALNTARQAGSRYASRLSGIASVSGAEQTVTITLITPNGALPTLLDIPIPMDNSDRPLGTGPYLLKEQDEELSLALRPDWWQNGITLPVSEIPLKSVSKSDELILSFESGDVALVDVDLMGTNSLGYSGSYETWDYATTSMLYLGFNTASGLCRDVRVRRALALAIDRESIAQVDFARHAVPAPRPVHPHEVGVAEGADRLGAVLLAAGPQIAAGEAAEHRRLARLAALALEGEEDLLDAVGHGAAAGRPSATQVSKPLARSSQAGHAPQPYPQGCSSPRSPR